MNDFVTCDILNAELLATTTDNVVVILIEGIKDKSLINKYACNLSVADVMNAQNDKAFLSAIKDSVFNLPNSSQLVVEMHTQGYPLAKKINVFDLMKKTFAMAEKEQISNFFLCANEEEKNYIELSVKELFPDLKIADVAVTGEDNLVDKINNSKADIVWLGMGEKAEAVWMQENATHINAFTIGIGYGFHSFIKGKVWNETRRFRPDYIMMNINYLILTGKKFLWTTLAWIPALMVIMTIFILSSQTGTISKTTSGRIAEQVTYSSLFGYDFRYLSLTNEQFEDLNSFIRFLAHIGEYALLSLCIGFAVTVNGVRKKLRFIYMCILGFLVSLADEFMQIFVKDRYGDLYDVACDFLGVIIVAFFVFVIGRKVKPVKLKDNNHLPRRRKFLNIYIDDISFKDAVDRIIEMAKTDSKQYVITPNVDHVIKNEKDILFRKIYERADLILTDGTPLMWIADSFGYPIKEKIPGSDMLPRVCEAAAKEEITFFFFGAMEGVAEKAAENLRRKYPGVKIVGCYSPPIGFERNKPELEKAINAINAKKADILVLSLGSPKQEKFIYNHLNEIYFHVALPFGAAIDFEAGNVNRAPLWMRKSGLEWFYRFLQEPGRLFKRYFIDDIKIFWIAWKYRNEIMRLQ